jgi:hypothetical protein
VPGGRRVAAAGFRRAPWWGPRPATRRCRCSRLTYRSGAVSWQDGAGRQDAWTVDALRARPAAARPAPAPGTGWIAGVHRDGRCGVAAITYAAAVPTSRKRKPKKSGKSGRSRKPARVTRPESGSAPGGPLGGGSDRRELAGTSWSALAAYGEQVVSERASRAAAGAEALVPAVVQAVAAHPDMIVEDELCVRMGAQLREWAQEPADKRVGPGLLAEATIRAAASAVATALRAPAEQAGQAPVEQTAPAEPAGPVEHPGGQHRQNTRRRNRLGRWNRWSRRHRWGRRIRRRRGGRRGGC